MIKWKKNLTPPLGWLCTNIQYVISTNETLTVLVHKLSVNVFFCLFHYNVHKSVQAREDPCIRSREKSEMRWDTERKNWHTFVVHTWIQFYDYWSSKYRLLFIVCENREMMEKEETSRENVDVPLKNRTVWFSFLLLPFFFFFSNFCCLYI